MEEGRSLIEYLIHSKTIPQVLFPSNLRESEGHSPSAGSRGWPLVTAKRATSPSAEGWREVRREEGTHRNAWFPSSLRESDAYDDLGTQFWGWSLPVDDFLAPLVLERDQQTRTQPA
jgi:hypothetical protein